MNLFRKTHRSWLSTPTALVLVLSACSETPPNTSPGEAQANAQVPANEGSNGGGGGDGDGPGEGGDNDGPGGGGQMTDEDGRSPNNPRRRRGDNPPAETPRGAGAYPEALRTFDGSSNNLEETQWGQAGQAFLRIVPTDYADGTSVPNGEDRPSARWISAQLGAIAADGVPSPTSDLFWQWGQFIDHDLDLAPEVTPAEHFDIEVPAGDAWFDPQGTGEVLLPLGRSSYVEQRGVREQINSITAYIDASHVYGSDLARARALRTLDGSGRLATSDGNLLPFNTAGLDNAAPSSAPAASFYLAGDFRANEQVGLTAMHTLFVREHNFQAARIRREDPTLSGDAVYERARAFVAAEMQAITYREFLPLLIGPNALPDYDGYDDDVDAGISNIFATAAFRVGHSMVSGTFPRVGANGNEHPSGNLSLAEAFFTGPRLFAEHGIEPILRGLAGQRAQTIDLVIVDELRNFLFGPPGAGGLDLPALNIQRGREHGLPSYVAVRRALNLPPARSFGAISEDPSVVRALAAAYDGVEQVDAWVGMLAEPHRSGAMVGETMARIIGDQFRRTRDGDRFWYERYLPNDLVEAVEDRSFADILRDHADVEAGAAAMRLGR